MKELIAIQNELVVLKDQEKQGIKFKFRKCEQIFQEVKPLCKEYGVLLVVSDEMVCIGERYYIKATATVSKDGVKESASGWAREPDKLMAMSYPQITGSCSSYARKYAMGGLFNLDDNQDPDTIENAPQPQQKAKTQPFNEYNKDIKLMTSIQKSTLKDQIVSLERIGSESCQKAITGIDELLGHEKVAHDFAESMIKKVNITIDKEKS